MFYPAHSSARDRRFHPDSLRRKVHWNLHGRRDDFKGFIDRNEGFAA
jgi:hypothetical protein